MAFVHYIIGASGTGKSTRALARVREHPRAMIIATDVIRAQLRTAYDRSTLPDLWAESFNVPTLDSDFEIDGVNIDGFLRQCAPILRAVEASVDYCLNEGWDCVVEGVHLVPGEFEVPKSSDTLDVSATLCVVDDHNTHRSMFSQRDTESGGNRPADHYHANLLRIHIIQGYLRERWNAWETMGIERTTVDADARM